MPWYPACIASHVAFRESLATVLPDTQSEPNGLGVLCIAVLV